MRSLDRRDAPALLAALPVMAVFAWWTADHGGYSPTDWMPGLVGIACVVGTVVALGAGGLARSRPALVAIAAFAAYTLWSFASILWADAPGPALEGSQRTLLYLLCFTGFALLAWTPRALLVLLGLFVLAITVLGLVTLVRVAAAADPSGFFIQARLIAPLGYQNASAALWTGAAIPALVLATRPEVIAWLRPLLLGASGLLLGLALTTQSRGWLFTLPVVVLATVALAPGRARLIAFALPVAGALLLISGELLEPYRAAGALSPAETGPALSDAFGDATRALLLAAAALVAVAAVMVWAEMRVERRLAPAPPVRRRLTALLLATLAAACVTTGLVATHGDPAGQIDSAWTQFKDLDGAGDDGNRFAVLGSSRYDFWRVGLNAWREQPVAGLGQDNFAQAYVAHRAISYEEPRWVHSLPLRLLVHTGLVGAALFVLFAVAAGFAAAGAMRRRSDDATARLAGAVALLPAVVWLAHGAVDWLWEYPALSGPALGFAGAATAMRTAAAPGRRAAGPPRRLRMVAAGIAVLLCVALVLPAYVAERDTRAAAARWPSDPGGALERLERARALDPLGTHASLVEGLIATRLSRFGQARTSFARAAAREPHDWFARFELGLLAGARGDRGAALTHLQAAGRLNPLDPVVAEAMRLARAGTPMSLELASREFASRDARIRGRE